VYNARMKLAALSLLLLGACGGSSMTSADAQPDAHVGPDAPPPDATTPFGCLGLPLPTTAPSMITIAGKTEEIKNLAAQGLAGTTVTAFKVQGDQQVGTATSASDGTYSFQVATGGVPLDGYVLGHHADVGTTKYYDDYLYPGRPLFGDETSGVILMLTPNTLGLITGLVGQTQDPAKGMLGLVVLDCNGAMLAGATVTTEPAATVYYDMNGLPTTPDKASVTDTDGRAYVLNLPPGPVTVHATINSMTLRAHTVNARAGVVTTTAIEP
jgi:hypothetical protein